MTQKQRVFNFLEELKEPLSKKDACDLFLKKNKDLRVGVFNFYSKQAIEESIWVPKEPLVNSINLNMDVRENKALDITTIDLKKVDMSKFIAIKTGTTFDRIASKRDGLMRGTVNMVAGPPGCGKTSLCANLAKNIREIDKTITTGFISAEMDQNDWIEECIDNPELAKLETLYLLDYLDAPNYLDILKEALMRWDYVIVDSFEVIIDQLKEMMGWTSKRAETELIKMLRQSAFERFSTLMVIQQFTKGGTYVGSSKIKHLTTSMMYVMVDDNDDRYVTFTKNRRCGHMVGKKLYFTKNKTTGNIEWNQKRFDNYLAVAEHSSNELNKINEEEDFFNNHLLEKREKINAAEEIKTRQKIDVLLNVKEQTPVDAE